MYKVNEPEIAKKKNAHVDNRSPGRRIDLIYRLRFTDYDLQPTSLQTTDLQTTDLQSTPRRTERISLSYSYGV